MTAGQIENLPLAWYRAVMAAMFVIGPVSYRLGQPSLAAPAALLAIGLLLIATWGRFVTPPRAALFVAALVLAVVSVNVAGADYTTAVRNGYRHTQMNRFYHDREVPATRDWNRGPLFHDVVSASTTLAQRLGPDPYYFWYDAHDELGMFFRSITSTFFAWTTLDLLNEDFAGASEGAVRTAVRFDGRRMRDLVILTRRANVSFEGPALTRRWTLELTADGVPYYVHYFAYHASADAGDQR
jgi:hypothetical protein